MNLKKAHFAFMSVLIFLSSNSELHAEDSAADVEAMQELSDSIANWWDRLPKDKPLSLAILNVSVNEKLSSDFPRIAEDIIVSTLSRSKNTSVIPCFECRRPNITVKGDRLLISKGIPNQDAMLELAKKLELDSFMTVYVTKTAFSLKARINVHQSSTGEIYASESFSVANWAIYDSSMHFLVGNGLSWDISLKGRRLSDQSIPFSISFAFLQSVGRYTRAGITGGGLFLARTGNVGYLMPTLGWKIQLGRSVFSFLPSLQMGYGFRFPSSVADAIEQQFNMGLAGGINFDLLIGQFFFVGGKLNAYMPFGIKDMSELTIYPGFHIGMSIGG